MPLVGSAWPPVVAAEDAVVGRHRLEELRACAELALEERVGGEPGLRALSHAARDGALLDHGLVAYQPLDRALPEIDRDLRDCLQGGPRAIEQGAVLHQGGAGLGVLLEEVDRLGKLDDGAHRALPPLSPEARLAVGVPGLVVVLEPREHGL